MTANRRGAQEASRTLSQPFLATEPRWSEKATIVKTRPDVNTEDRHDPILNQRTEIRRSARCRSFAARLQPQSLEPRRRLLPIPASLGQLVILNHGEDLAKRRSQKSGESVRCQHTRGTGASGTLRENEAKATSPLNHRKHRTAVHARSGLWRCTCSPSR